MQYYVIGPDGSKYGPADVPTLKQWAGENRLNAQSILEDFNSGQRVQAGQVEGIFDAPQPAPTATVMNPVEQSMYQNPPAPGYYPRQAAGDGGRLMVTLSWIFSSVGFLCCPIIFSTTGIILAVVGRTQGHAKWLAPMLFGCFTLVAGIVLGILSNNWAQEFLRQLQQQQSR